MNAVLAPAPAVIEPVDHNRQKLIGGSDVAAILGISPWKTELQVYLDKIQPRSGEPDRNKARVFSRGKRMEPYVIDLLAEEAGVEIAARGNRYRDPELDFLAAEIDAETTRGENVEIKTVSPWKAWEWGEERTDEIPVHYTAQAMHGLMVTGRAVCIFGVLIGADDFRMYRIERDDETIAGMRAREVEFWEHVQRREPPPARNTEDLLALFERDSGASVSVSDADLIAVNRMRDIKATLKPLEEEFEQLKQQVQLSMRDAANLLLEGKAIATWKSQGRTAFDQAAFSAAHPALFEQFKRTATIRVFRIK